MNFQRIPNGFPKDLVKNLIEFQRISQGLGCELNLFLKDFKKKTQLISKGFGKELKFN